MLLYITSSDYYGSCINVKAGQLLPLSRRFCFNLCLLVGWFVTRITQNLLNRLPQNLDGGPVAVQNRAHQLLVPIQVKGRFQECFFLSLSLTLWDRGGSVFFNILVHFSGSDAWTLMKTGICGRVQFDADLLSSNGGLAAVAGFIFRATRGRWAPIAFNNLN